MKNIPQRGLEYHATQKPVLEFDSFFNGPVRAYGMIQDFRKKARRRFTIEMRGTWKSAKGTLEEHFIYDDGEEQNRIWHVEKISGGAYRATADDIIGEAIGQARGNAMFWKYRLRVNIGEKPFVFAFDDRMFLLSDRELINRSYMKKFGLTLAELSIFIQKQDDHDEK